MALLDDPQYVADLRSELSNVAIGAKWGTSEKSVRRAKKKLPAATVAGESSEESSDGSKVVTAIRNRPVTLADARAWIEASGDDPDDYVLSIRSIAYGLDMFSNRMSATPKRGRSEAASTDIDPVGILAQLRSENGPRIFSMLDEGADESTFVISINDVQLGQSYNGGSAATIARFYEFIALAVKRITELRKIGRKLERIVFIFGGDLVEGCFIYPHQMRSIDLNRKKQIEGVVALILHAIDTLAPLFERVTALATKGNHGEHREGGKKIDLSDNDDTLCVEMAKLALERDPDMQHIDWIIADEEAAVWAPVYDWTLVTTHGDIYAKGVSGATTERKAHAWIKNMAAAFRKFGRIGRADVLITHHFHHDEMADWGDTLWRQTTSQDRGSPEFSQATGQYSEPGMLTGVMTPTQRWQDEAVLR
ncbi:hypothetical protein EV379_1233 [Microterricola gilva]|uniref:Uncharacterized protein n=1 Tax=Microterricola gilva TaxID=393267 RepID=A0A4Q8AK91_9MICO|nr:hypothetical protein [Microterricola gilva]RZU64922.1 hypothetical protein EV379_1233 [Microterricola gilva]